MTHLHKEFTHLYNISVHHSSFPDDWKIATVIPIPKVPNPDNPNELRPISLLPIPGKILEALVHDQLYTYIENNNLLNNRQYGFRKNKSTSMALATLLDDLALNLNDNDPPTAVFIDLKKAFDTLNHEILLNKLTSHGIVGKPLLWIKDYLTNRQQCVLANGTKSDTAPITTGVPQGSILGPLLFILYINDLPLHLENVCTQLYADDTIIYTANKSQETSHKTIQKALTDLSDWCTTNKLTINIQKTKVLHFRGGRRKQYPTQHQTPLLLNNTPLDTVEHYTYLGTTLDHKLSGEQQVKKVTQTANCRLTTLAKIRKNIDTKTTNLLYKTMVLPILEYNSAIYNFTTAQNSQKLQRIQNRAIRIITKTDKTTSTTELQNKLKLQPLHRRWQNQLLTLMHIRSRNPIHTQTAHRTTRQTSKYNIKIPRPKTQLLKNAPCYKGAQIWNALPEAHKALELRPFKKYIKHKTETSTPTHT